MADATKQEDDLYLIQELLMLIKTHFTQAEQTESGLIVTWKKVETSDSACWKAMKRLREAYHLGKLSRTMSSLAFYLENSEQ